MRLSWDEYFLGMAEYVSKRSTCPSRKVGAVIVNPETNQVISMGYNGAPRGVEHCTNACLKRVPGTDYETCKAVHGEINAIVSAAMNGGTTMGSTLYLTCTPCVMCARIIINAGVKRVVATSYYGHLSAIHLLESAEVEIEWSRYEA